MRRPEPGGEDERQRRRRAPLFDAEAERYAARRPSYPDELFDAVADYGHLAAGARVLEIAPGPGQATVALAARGYRITGVELGERLAAVARQRLAAAPDVRIEVAAFEDWPLPAEPFDLVLCATAFHWLDPAVRLARSAAALRPGGVLALVWTHHVAGGTDEFFARSEECYRRFSPEKTPGFPPPPDEELEPLSGEVAVSPLFTDVRDLRFGRDLDYTAAEYVDLLRTYSDTLVLEPERREGLLGCLAALIDQDFGGRITKRHSFELVLARRV